MFGHPTKKKTTPIHMHDDECWECERVLIKCSINLKNIFCTYYCLPFYFFLCKQPWCLNLKRTFWRFYHDFIEGNWRRIKSTQRQSRYVTETNGGSKMMQLTLRYNLIVITKKQIVAIERVELFGFEKRTVWDKLKWFIELLTCFRNLISFWSLCDKWDIWKTFWNSLQPSSFVHHFH